MSVCLFVLYAFKNRTCKCNETFHGTPLGPEEGRHGVGITKKGQERGGGYLGEISSSVGVLLFRLIFQRFEKITYDLY